MSKNKRVNKTSKTRPLAQTPEVDYELLQQCIKNALKETQEQPKHGNSREWMKWILYLIFDGLILVSIVIGIALFIRVIQIAGKIDAVNASDGLHLEIQLLVDFIATLFLVGLVIFSIEARKEIEQETDAMYVATIFSGSISMVALIVALIALVVEVL